MAFAQSWVQGVRGGLKIAGDAACRPRISPHAPRVRRHAPHAPQIQPARLRRSQRHFGTISRQHVLWTWFLELWTALAAARVLGLPDAIRRMTGWPASRMGLNDRGILREGLRADSWASHSRQKAADCTTALYVRTFAASQHISKLL